MSDVTEYERQKQEHKRKLVRNEFAVCGKYDMPFVQKQKIEVDKIKLMSFVDAKNPDDKNIDKTIHFFMHDWKFEKVYERAEEEGNIMPCFHLILVYLQICH